LICFRLGFGLRNLNFRRRLSVGYLGLLFGFGFKQLLLGYLFFLYGGYKRVGKIKINNIYVGNVKTYFVKFFIKVLLTNSIF